MANRSIWIRPGNRDHPNSAIVYVNFTHDVNGVGAIKLLGECSKSFSATVVLHRRGRKQPQNDMLQSAFYAVTPNNPADVRQLAQELAKNLRTNQLVRQAWRSPIDVRVVDTLPLSGT